MIDNVSSLKNHLQKGFRIKEISYHQYKSTEIRVLLIKAKNSIKYIIKNISDELISFLNSKILSVKIWKGDFSNIEIVISGNKFSELINAVFIWKLEPSNQTTAFRFVIDLNLDQNKKFIFLDFREKIEVFFNGELKFGGLITAVKPHNKLNNIFYIECEDYSCVFDTEYIIADIGFNKGYLMDTAIFFLDLSNSGVYYTSNSIKGIHLEKRNFEIIMPLKGIEITRSFQIGDCMISPKLPEIAKIKNNKEFSSFKTFARLKLLRTKFSEAYTDGINLIEGIISFLNYQLKLPIFQEYYEFKNNSVLIEVGKFISVQDLNNSTIIVMPIPFKKSPLFEIKSRNHNIFGPIANLGQYYLDAERNFSKEEKQGLWILHYLNRAESNVNRTAAFLDIWVAFDFMISRYAPISKVFSDSVFNEVKDFCNRYTDKKIEDLENSLKIEELTSIEINNKKEEIKNASKRLNDIVGNFFNNPSIKIRLDNLLTNNKITLSKLEWSIYKRARDTRNSIIHGKEVHINRNEYRIISKIIYAVLNKAFVINFQTKNYSKKYICFKCKKEFNSKKIPRGLLNKQGTLMGHYCDDCKKKINKSFLDLFHQKNSCFHCKKLLGNIEATYKKYYENNELYLSYKYICPHCKYSGETLFLITFDIREPYKIITQK